jgi:hypothetical protein
VFGHLPDTAIRVKISDRFLVNQSKRTQLDRLSIPKFVANLYGVFEYAADISEHGSWPVVVKDFHPRLYLQFSPGHFSPPFSQEIFIVFSPAFAIRIK